MSIKESEISDFLLELEDLKGKAQLNANDLMRNDEMRAKSQGVADAYAFCQIRLRQMLGIFAKK